MGAECYAQTFPRPVQIARYSDFWCDCKCEQERIPSSREQQPDLKRHCIIAGVNCTHFGRRLASFALKYNRIWAAVDTAKIQTDVGFRRIILSLHRLQLGPFC